MLSDLHRNKKKNKKTVLTKSIFFQKNLGMLRLPINRLSQCGKCMDNYLIQVD
ncbi:Uncharacterised protein [Legionella pneumophila]|nr:Uncharacterised protein [Legionella pneumophila]CZI25745.1 Uncharacterised protein [Legionella pneumophila]